MLRASSPSPGCATLEPGTGQAANDVKLGKADKLAAAAALLALAAAAWLGLRPLPGPVQSLSSGGLPVIDAATSSGRVGQDFTATAFLYNSSPDRIMLISAVLVPVPGQRPPRLSHVAIDHSVGMVGADQGWPPKGLPLSPLPGARIGHGQTNIVFGVTGRRPGFWPAAGLKITYLWQGTFRTVIAWSVNAACIGTRGCSHLLHEAQTRTGQLADDS
jgi:hypothetical protein